MDSLRFGWCLITTFLFTRNFNVGYNKQFVWYQRHILYIIDHIIYESFHVNIAFIKIQHCCEFFCIRIYCAWIAFIITYIFINKLTFNNIIIYIMFQNITYNVIPLTIKYLQHRIINIPIMRI